MNDRVYLVALHKIGITHRLLHLLFENKQNYGQVCDIISFNFLKKYGVDDAKINFILENKRKLKLEGLEAKLNNLGVEIITYFDDEYPKNLKNIFNPPFLLYVRGNISLPCLAFVGSRAMTSYGKSVVEKLVPEVGKYFNIVSGGALGCDTESHEVALKNNIKTISVIGTGIDECYPVGNKRLYDKIVENGGAVISIFPLGEPGNAYNFPVRNEIVAGISEGIIVIEAKEKSGSLITAKLGLDLGKEVFAVPGDIFKVNSAGCNTLILKGEAKMIVNANDILNEFNIRNKENKEKVIPDFIDEESKKIYDLLLLEALNIDEISLKLNLSISFVLLKISMLELSSLVRKNEVGKYEII